LLLKAYKVNPDAVSPLRQQIVKEAFEAINSKSLNEAMRALKTLSAALSYPYGVLGQDFTVEERSAWDSSIVTVLEGLDNIVKNKTIDPFVAVEVRGMVSWHAALGSENSKAIAKKVLQAIPETLSHEVSRGLADAWGWTFEREDGRYGRGEIALLEWRKKLVRKLLKQYEGKLPELLKLLEERAAILNSAKMSRNPDPGPFLGAVMEASPEFTELLGQYLLSTPASPLIDWFSAVVTVMAKHDRTASLNLAKEALKKDNVNFDRSVARALGWGVHNLEVVPEEIEIIKTLACSKDQWTRNSIVRGVKRFPNESKPIALDILLSVDITESAEIAGEVLGEFDEKYGAFKVEDLTNEQIQKVLNSLIKCPSINEYQISLFLSKVSLAHPLQTLKMLMERVEHYEAHPKVDAFQPLPYSWRESEALLFSRTTQYEQLLRIVRDWATKSPAGWIRTHYGAELFKLVSAGFDEITLKVLREWILSADEQHLEKAASLLSEANNTFVWNNEDFVIKLLEQAQKYGNACYKRVSSYLYSSVIQGGRSGTPGQPFPEDITQSDRSAEMMAKLPHGSPSYRFYKSLYDDAKANIERHTNDESDFEDS
jgi:hypothetical protein